MFEWLHEAYFQQDKKKGAGLKSTPVIIQYPMKNHL